MSLSLASIFTSMSKIDHSLNRGFDKDEISRQKKSQLFNSKIDRPELGLLVLNPWLAFVQLAVFD